MASRSPSVGASMTGFVSSVGSQAPLLMW